MEEAGRDHKYNGKDRDRTVVTVWQILISMCLPFKGCVWLRRVVTMQFWLTSFDFLISCFNFCQVYFSRYNSIKQKRQGSYWIKIHIPKLISFCHFRFSEPHIADVPALLKMPFKETLSIFYYIYDLLIPRILQ